MKHLAILACCSLLISPYARANFATDCKFAYRVSSESLTHSILDFKDQKMSAPQLGVAATSIDTQVEALRAACYFGEPAENRTCVEKYSKIYSALKTKLNIAELINGKQKDVDYSGIENAIVNAKIKVTDFSCGF